MPRKLLAEFQQDAKPGLFDLANIENELPNLLAGVLICKHLRTSAGISANEAVCEAAISMNPYY